ncbi:DUF3015 family protein [Nitrospira sp. Kam-Ns4a]
MIRKLAAIHAVLLFAGLQAVTVWAGTADTGPGCGLGKEVWKDSKDTDSVGHHLLISTTNNPMIPLQAGGITTGSWGCQNNRKVWTEHKANVFASLNFESLAADMARGGGEHLASLADLLGVPAERRPAFFALAQERYAHLTAAGQTSAAAMIRALNEAMAAHPVLAEVSVQR